MVTTSFLSPVKISWRPAGANFGPLTTCDGAWQEHKHNSQEHKNKTQEHKNKTQEHKHKTQGQKNKTQVHKGKTHEHKVPGEQALVQPTGLWETFVEDFHQQVLGKSCP